MNNEGLSIIKSVNEIILLNGDKNILIRPFTLDVLIFGNQIFDDQ